MFSDSDFYVWSIEGWERNMYIESFFLNILSLIVLSCIRYEKNHFLFFLNLRISSKFSVNVLLMF